MIVIAGRSHPTFLYWREGMQSGIVHHMCPLVRLPLLVMFVTLPVIASDANSAPRFPSLQSGMAFHEVAGLWGAPQEKSEREVKREYLWSYPQGEVLFREGVVVSWTNRNQPAAPLLEQEQALAASRKKQRNEENAEFDQLLNEIMRELPDEPPTPGGAAPTTPPPLPNNPAATGGIPPLPD